MPIDHIRLSQQAKEQLTRLKRWTGLRHWNELCRWAFCASLAEPTIPAPAKIMADSSVEMSWRVFGGQYHELYLALLRQRCANDGLGTSDEVLANQLRLHLHRGLGYLAADRQIRSVAGLMKRVAKQGDERVG
jgi:DNA sulfur modification protein DndE